MKKLITIFIILISQQYIFCLSVSDYFISKINSENIVPSWYFDVLKSKERDTVMNFTQVYQNSIYSDIDGDTVFPWCDEQIFKIEKIEMYNDTLVKDYKNISIGYDHYYILTEITLINNYMFRIKGYEYYTNE